MFSNRKLVSGLVSRVRAAERETLEALGAGRVEQEPAVTDRLLGAMEHLLNGASIGGVRWAAKTLTDRGRGSQESLYGADFLAVFEVKTRDFGVAKGFLAQAKLLEPADAFETREFQRLREQCRRMLGHSPAAYVFLYSQQSGIVVIPAIEILDSRPCNPHEITSKPLGKFFQEHFECFVGDHSIRSANASGLHELRLRYEVGSIFHLSGTSTVNE